MHKNHTVSGFHPSTGLGIFHLYTACYKRCLYLTLCYTSAYKDYFRLGIRFKVLKGLSEFNSLHFLVWERAKCQGNNTRGGNLRY